MLQTKHQHETAIQSSQFRPDNHHQKSIDPRDWIRIPSFDTTRPGKEAEGYTIMFLISTRYAEQHIY